jgi:2-oxoglutarate/2-oxoacid ferredoxin oxidoreductase subunit alpha
VTDDGVSPMSIPGMIGGMYQTNGLEHDEQGRPSAMYTTHEIMNAKRYRKLDAIAKRYPLVKRFGPPRADLGILCWGSAAGPVREALEALKTSNGPTVAAFVPQLITPLPVKELEEFIASCSSILIIELSFAAQFYQYLRTQVDLPKGKTRVHARSGGMNLSVSEVMSQIQLALDASKIMEEVTA